MPVVRSISQRLATPPSISSNRTAPPGASTCSFAESVRSPTQCGCNQACFWS